MTTTDPPTREFTVDDLYTVYSGCLLSRRHMDAVYDVVDFVTGQAGHMTHQLPRVTTQTVAPELLRQHPWLAEVEKPTVDSQAEVGTWAAAMAECYGEMHVVTQMPEGAYVGREPMAELVEMVGRDRVVPIGTPPADLDGGPR